MIKDKYIDMVKSRVDIVQLAQDLHPNVSITRSGLHRRKCLCVFHQEKTPSLYFDIALNRYHCFGCNKSGDVISFVRESLSLGFEDAVKYLLEKYCPDVDITDILKKLSPEEEDLQRKRETQFIYMEYAYRFYLEAYQGETAEAIACRRYAESDEHNPKGRWDSQFCKMYGLGYSPSSGTAFVNWAKDQGLRMDILCDMGLVKERESSPGTYYDFYRNRLMIPQRDRFGRVITFTARVIGDQSEFKYLNGSDCLIYSKHFSVFGIDVALKSARQTGKVYLLEGAPDVLRLQSLGISNSIASLGGSWCKEQLQQFKSFMPTLCFIPDNDVPKANEKFGKGVQFVFRNARLAIELGFRVNVREIVSESNKKQDADSYIVDMTRWESLQETDFILWYASKVYDPSSTRDDQLKVINEICDMLVCVSDDTLQSSYLCDLKTRYKQASVWKTALSDAARRQQERKRRQAIKQAGDDLENYNFYRQGKHYYGIDSQGREKDWTNFIIKPLFLIADDDNPTRIFEFENENGQQKTIELKQCDVTKLEKFKEKIEGKGNFRFFERPEKYECLKAYMYDKTEEAYRIPQMGWNNIGEEGFFAFCNGIVYHGEWIPIDEYGIIRLEKENFYLPALSKIHQRNKNYFANERRFIHDPQMNISLHDYFQQIIDVYGENGMISLCYYLATLFRDIIVSTTKFPLLNIYGKKGTGKTEFAISLMCLFQRSPEISNLENTSLFAMGDKCSQVSNEFVHFDEYKNSLKGQQIDFLKGIYDSAGRSKKSADSERRETTNVDCGVILTGQEMASADIALFTRLIFLESQQSVRTVEATAKFNKLEHMRRMGPTNITVDLQKYRETFEARWSSCWNRAQKDLKNRVDSSGIDERFINNWAILLSTMYCLEDKINDLPFTTSQVFDSIVKGIKYQASLSNSIDEIATFWSLFSKARQLGDIIEGQDYKIDFRTSLSVTRASDQGKKEVLLDYGEGKQILFIRKDICLSKVNIQAKREGKVLIPDDSLCSYLISSSSYQGKTKSPLKFNTFDKDGNPKRKSSFDAVKQQTVYEILYDQERVLAFDYDMICEAYDIDLKRLSIITTNSNFD